jgi:hypothetical protein
MDKSNFIFNNKNIEEFKSIISELSTINSVIKMKITSTNLMLYTIDTAGKNSAVGNALALAVKSYIFPYDYFFKIKHYDEDETKGNIDWIIKDGKILNKKIAFFSNNLDIKGTFNLRKLPTNDEVKYTRSVVITDGKFKFSLTGDEPHVIRDISVEQLNSILNPDLSDLSFKISTKEFESARSVSRIEPDDIITIYIKDGKIYFKQIYLVLAKIYLSILFLSNKYPLYLSNKSSLSP